MVTFATGLSVVTLSLHHRGMRGTRLSPWLRFSAAQNQYIFLSLILPINCDPPSPIPISMMVRYLVLHLLARLLHIQLEGNGQDEEEGIKVDMRIKTKKKRRQEVNDGKVENTGGVAAEGWKKGWEEEEEEKSVENWKTLIGLELGARLARLENFQVFIQDCCTGWHQEWKQAWKLTRDISRRRKQGNSLRWSGNMPPLSSIGTQALYL